MTVRVVVRILGVPIPCRVIKEVIVLAAAAWRVDVDVMVVVLVIVELRTVVTVLERTIICLLVNAMVVVTRGGTEVVVVVLN